jgi:hypothetical protein
LETRRITFFDYSVKLKAYLPGIADGYAGLIPVYMLSIPTCMRSMKYFRETYSLPCALSEIMELSNSVLNPFRMENPYVLSKNDGVVYKQVFRKKGNEYGLHSDNPVYEPY